MKNAKLLCRKHGLCDYNSVLAAELMADAIAEDVLHILKTYSVRPLHERIAQYFRFQPKQK